MIKVWTNGCFDILHRGHFEMLKYAKSLGDFLIVGIDSDKKVQADKGPLRPLNRAEDRRFALEAIRYVDEVVVFGSPEGLAAAIKKVSPDIMVIGSDWKGKKIVGEQHTKEVRFFDRIGQYSTTSIIEGTR
jgi:D-beta-D-heptose 7-phosphate kinase/D-beta-D-heptose 1-phosphate adenosyltransferase|tara:strand:+ start:20693 stop:21085 length:393 start_codon:yes stop_codon:yes gene_type:complete